MKNRGAKGKVRRRRKKKPHTHTTPPHMFHSQRIANQFDHINGSRSAVCYFFVGVFLLCVECVQHTLTYDSLTHSVYHLQKVITRKKVIRVEENKYI